VPHCLSTDSKHCFSHFYVKFCSAPMCLEVWSLAFEAWLLLLTFKLAVNVVGRTNREEQLWHRAVSLRQHGFLVNAALNNQNDAPVVFRQVAYLFSAMTRPRGKIHDNPLPGRRLGRDTSPTHLPYAFGIWFSASSAPRHDSTYKT